MQKEGVMRNRVGHKHADTIDHRRVALLVPWLLTAFWTFRSVPAAAQDIPVIEAWGGYSFLFADSGNPLDSRAVREDSFGWILAAGYHVTRPFSVFVEATANHKKKQLEREGYAGVTTDQDVSVVVVGGRLSHPLSSRLTLFADGAAGVHHLTNHVFLTSPESIQSPFGFDETISLSDPIVQAGGGFDERLRTPSSPYGPPARIEKYSSAGF